MPDPASPPPDPPPRKRGLIDGSFWFLLTLAVLTGGAALAVKGPAILPDLARGFVEDLVVVAPKIVLGITIGALFTLVLPRAVVARFLGEQAGARGILLASLLGMVMPGGPFTSFPLVYALGRSGAAVGPLMAFIVAWSIIGLNRMLIWEVPFLGFGFTAVHFLVSLPAPILAGMLARRLSDRLPALRTRFGD